MEAACLQERATLRPRPPGWVAVVWTNAPQPGGGPHPHLPLLPPDLDECALGTHNCSEAETCHNIRGGFRCLRFECPPNYVRVSET